MNELMIIIFGLATVRTLTPLSEKDNFTFAKLLNAALMCWAFYHLMCNCAIITFK